MTRQQARDAAQAEMVSLKAQADREQQEFEAKWRDLGELIERDRKGKDAPKSPKGKTLMASRVFDSQQHIHAPYSSNRSCIDELRLPVNQIAIAPHLW